MGSNQSKLMISVVLFLISLFMQSAVAAQMQSKAELGRLLYFDTDLSLNKNQSCASCHTPAGFADPNNAMDPANNVVSLGSVTTLNGGRNAPSAAYAAFTPRFRWDPAMAMYIGGQFWDGRSATLTIQAQGPFLNPVEMAMPSKVAVLAAIASELNINNTAYTSLFSTVYGITLDTLLSTEDNIYINTVYVMVADAIAAYEKTRELSKFSSKYDYYLAGMADLTPEEAEGLALFNGQGQCSACHTSAPLTAPNGFTMPPLFTDFTYDNLGIPKSMNLLIVNNPIDNGLGGRTDIAAMDPNGLQLGKFKVVTLRNVELTAPYGHNGYFATLADIVSFYNTRDVGNWAPPEVSNNLNTTELGNLGLSPDDEAAIVAFMKTLTDGYGTPLNTFPFPPFP